MSFNIELMRTISPKNMISKETELIQTVTGTLKEPTSIIDPIVIIECDLSSFVNCNYMHIPAFNRYYYVNNMRSITNNLVEFTCHVDVLKTYDEGIRSNTAIIKRQENKWNLYLDDGTFKVYQNPNILTKAFPSGFDTMEFVLAVAGS